MKPVEHDRYFSTDHLNAVLRQRSLRGGTVTALGQGLRFVIQIVSTMVLARILDPADFGLVAMVVALTRFAEYFKDFGLSAATIQRKEVNHAQISTMFWINAAIGCATAGMVAIAAPVIAWFYGDGRLMKVSLAVSTTFILAGLSVQHQALLRRQMRFQTLVALNVVAQVLGVSVAIVAALTLPDGAGYWALVMAMITTPLVLMVGYWSTCHWRPGRPVRHSGVRSMLAFGGNMTAFNAVNYLARNLDSVLIGKFCGGRLLGFYDKAYQLLLLPITQVNVPMAAVAIPALSRLQDDPVRYRRWYLNAVELLAFITMPACIFTVATAEPLVRIVLGPNWLPAIPLVRVLGVAGLIQSLYNTQGWLHVSLGRTDRMLRWGLVGTTVIVTSFLIGLPFGTLGVAIGYTVATYIILGPCLSYAGRPAELRFADVLRRVWRFAAASLVAGGLCAVSALVLGAGVHFGVLAAVQFAVMVVAYLAALIAFHGGLEPLRRVLALARDSIARQQDPVSKPIAANAEKPV